MTLHEGSRASPDQVLHAVPALHGHACWIRGQAHRPTAAHVVSSMQGQSGIGTMYNLSPKPIPCTMCPSGLPTGSRASPDQAHRQALMPDSVHRVSTEQAPHTMQAPHQYCALHAACILDQPHIPCPEMACTACGTGAHVASPGHPLHVAPVPN